MKGILVFPIAAILCVPVGRVWAEDLGKLSANSSNPDSTSNPYGA
jgi:hypothetical protein